MIKDHKYVVLHSFWINSLLSGDLLALLVVHGVALLLGPVVSHLLGHLLALPHRGVHTLIPGYRPGGAPAYTPGGAPGGSSGGEQTCTPVWGPGCRPALVRPSTSPRAPARTSHGVRPSTSGCRTCQWCTHAQSRCYRLCDIPWSTGAQSLWCTPVRTWCCTPACTQYCTPARTSWCTPARRQCCTSAHNQRYTYSLTRGDTPGRAPAPPREPGYPRTPGGAGCGTRGCASRRRSAWASGPQ